MALEEANCSTFTNSNCFHGSSYLWGRTSLAYRRKAGVPNPPQSCLVCHDCAHRVPERHPYTERAGGKIGIFEQGRLRTKRLQT